MEAESIELAATESEIPEGLAAEMTSTYDYGSVKISGPISTNTKLMAQRVSKTVTLLVYLGHLY